MIILLSLLFTIEAIGIILYLLLWINEFFNFRRNRQGIYVEDGHQFRVTPQKKFIFNLTLIILAFNAQVLSVIVRACSIRSIIQTTTDGTSNMVLYSLAIVLIILDLSTAAIFHLFLQCIYPLVKIIPWTQAEPKFHIVQELIIMLYSIVCALPQNSSYSTWIYLTFTPFACLTTLYLKTYYSHQTYSAATMVQATIIGSMVMLCIVLQRLTKVRSQDCVILIILIVLIFLFITFFSLLRKKRILIGSDRLSTSSAGVNWLWALETSFKYDDDSPMEQLLYTMINFQMIILGHNERCGDPHCLCNKKQTQKLLKSYKRSECSYELCNQLKVTLIEICLSRILSDSESELSIKKKNDIIGLLLIYSWMQINKSYLSCAYNLTKFHDCSRCSLSQCSQQYFLKRLIDHTVHSKQKESEDKLSNFQKMIYFETTFKTFIQIIDRSISSVNDFWQTIQKNQLDVIKANKYSFKILKNYQEFSSIYNFLKRECGDIILVESMSWKLHQEVLSFEFEAFQNLENIKNTMNMQRFKAKIGDNDKFAYSFRNYFIIIGVNPNNFQNILAVSKSLVKFTGYKEDFLLQSKLPVLLPKMLISCHEKFIKNFLKRKNISLSKFMLDKLWLQKNNGVLKPVQISVVPKIDINDGIKLIGIIQEIKKFEMLETNMPVNSVFGIFADYNFKVIHITENCIKHLNFQENIESLDLQVHQIIIDLPDEEDKQTEFCAQIDISLCQNQFIEAQKKQTDLGSRYHVKVCYKERDYGNDCIIREYLFVVLASAEENNSGIHALDARSLNVGTVNLFLNRDESFSDSQEKQSNDESETNQLELSSMASMSSTSSGTSSMSTQDAQITNIKNAIEFNSLPLSLKSYRIRLMLGFLLIMFTGFGLLGVNIYAKDGFASDLNALQTEKKMRNNFGSSKMALLLVFAMNNMPNWVNRTEYRFKTLDSQGPGPFFSAQLKDVVSRLQDSLVMFQQGSNDWDDTFVDKFDKDVLQLKFLTKSGNRMNQSMTFHKAITLYLDYLDYLGNSKQQDFKTTFDIFDENDVAEFQQNIKSTTGQLATILEYVYYIFFNGSEILLDQMYDIEKSFLSQILDHGTSLIKLILILASCCCGLAMVVVTFYIPYFVGVYHIQKQILNFVYRTDKKIVQLVINQCRDYADYIEQNKYLNESQDNKRTKNKGATSKIIRDPQEEFKENEQQYLGHFLNTNTKNSCKDLDFSQNNDTSMMNLKNYKATSTPIKPTKFKKQDWLPQQCRHIKEKFEQTDAIEKGDDENDEDDDEQKSQSDNPNDDQEIDGKQKHNKKQEIVISDEVNLSLIIKQTQRRKFMAGLGFYIVSSLIIAFHVSAYFLSNSIFSSYQQGFFQFDVFYLRNTCVTETHFLLMKSIIFNQSMSPNTYNGQQFQKVFDDCTYNEQKYRNIKKDASGIFQSIIQQLLDIVSADVCDFLISKKASGKECFTDGKGIMTMGVLQVIQEMQTNINQIKIKFEGMPSAKRTPDFLASTFYHDTTINDVTVYYTYLQWLFRYVQTSAKSILDTEIEQNFKQIVVIYIAFEVVIVILAFLCLIKMINFLKVKLQKIRLLLKLVPSMEILKQKELLEKLNTNLL